MIRMANQPLSGRSLKRRVWLGGTVVACCIVIGIATALWHPAVCVVILAAPPALLLAVKYPEAALVCYATCLVFAGPICDLLNIPTGYHALCAGALLACVLTLYAMRRRGRVALLGGLQIAALCLGVVLILGLLWTPSPQYGRLKVEGYILFDLLLLLGASLLGEDMPRLRMTVYVAGFMGVVFCLWGLVTVFAQQSGVWSESTLRAADPIGMGRRLGVFAISLIVLAQITKQPVAKALMLTVVGAVVFLMFYTGSRGAVLSLVLALFVYAVFLSRRPLWQGIVLAVVGAVVLYAIFSIIPFDAQSRFLYSTDPTSESGMSLIARQEFWNRAISLLVSHPVMGVGTGGYSYFANGIDMRDYPHNLLMEVSCELGVLGVAVLLWFLIASLRVAGNIFPRSASVNKGNFTVVWGIAVFLFALANSMMSGDIYTNSLLWFSSGFMWATSIALKKGSSHADNSWCLRGVRSSAE